MRLLYSLHRRLNPLAILVTLIIMIFVLGVLIGGNLALWVVNQRLDAILQAVR